jgi:hypothetical protein
MVPFESVGKPENFTMGTALPGGSPLPPRGHCPVMAGCHRCGVVAFARDPFPDLIAIQH